MTISVRLPPRVEESLAEYVVDSGLTKSEVVNLALESYMRTHPAATADVPPTLHERMVALGIFDAIDRDAASTSHAAGPGRKDAVRDRIAAKWQLRSGSKPG